MIIRVWKLKNREENRKRGREEPGYGGKYYRRNYGSDSVDGWICRWTGEIIPQASWKTVEVIIFYWLYRADVDVCPFLCQMYYKMLQIKRKMLYNFVAMCIIFSNFALP